MMMMPSCKHVTEHASDYLDGVGGSFERVMLRVHLLLCKHCRRFIHQFRLVIGISPALGEAQTPSEAEIDALLIKLLAADDPNSNQDQ